MSHKRTVTVPQRFWIRCTMIGVASVGCVVPTSYAQSPQVLVQGTSADTEDEVEDLQKQENKSDRLRPKTWEHIGAFVAEPIGKFWVGPQFVEGEPIYLLRTSLRPQVTIVEVSTTPLMPDFTSTYELSGRPDQQPAGW